MTDKSARPQDGDEVNPKIDPALNSNTEKEPDDWVSGGDPMTGAQASYLKTLRKNAARQRVSKLTSRRLKPQNGSIH